MDAIEKRARELLATVHADAGWTGLANEIRLNATFDIDHGLALAAIRAALTPPEGYVLVPVEERQDAKRFRWLKTCSKEQYLLARGVFGLAEDVIDAAIQSKEMEARNG